MLISFLNFLFPTLTLVFLSNVYGFKGLAVEKKRLYSQPISNFLSTSRFRLYFRRKTCDANGILKYLNVNIFHSILCAFSGMYNTDVLICSKRILIRSHFIPSCSLQLIYRLVREVGLLLFLLPFPLFLCFYNFVQLNSGPI